MSPTSEDGLKFLSSSWDRHVKLWDTETGKCINSFTCGKVPYQSKFRPGDNNSFISACSSKEIVQYDIRAGKQEYVYDYHLAAVNTVTFVDDGRRFISTSVRCPLPLHRRLLVVAPAHALVVAPAHACCRRGSVSPG